MIFTLRLVSKVHSFLPPLRLRFSLLLTVNRSPLVVPASSTADLSAFIGAKSNTSSSGERQAITAGGNNGVIKSSALRDLRDLPPVTPMIP